MSEKSNFKYYNLYEYLVNCNQDNISLTISKIENILGFKLPKSSSIASWWANDPFSGQSQAKAWYEADYLVRKNNGKVTFIKKQ